MQFTPAEIAQAIVGAGIVVYGAIVGGKQLILGAPKQPTGAVLPADCERNHETLGGEIANLRADLAATRADLRASEERAAAHREATQAALHKIELTLARMEGAGR